MKQEMKICFPMYKIAYSMLFMVLLSLVRGITTIDEIGLAIQPYLALLAVVFCADTYICEWDERRWEVFTLVPVNNRIKAIYQRISVQTLYLWAAGGIGFFLFFWQQPQNFRDVPIVREYGWYLCSMAVTVLFWGSMAVVITNLFHNRWAGIGCSAVLWLLIYSKLGVDILGKYNLFSYTLCRDLTQPSNMEWVYGNIVSCIAEMLMLMAIPVTVRTKRKGRQL